MFRFDASKTVENNNEISTHQIQIIKCVVSNVKDYTLKKLKDTKKHYGCLSKIELIGPLHVLLILT